jgi:hypothetical protein
LGLWARIQEGKNDPQKKKIEISCFDARYSLWEAGGFPCSLKAAHGGLRKKLALINQEIIFFFC